MVFSGQVTSKADLSGERRVLTDKLKILSRLLLEIGILIEVLAKSQQGLLVIEIVRT